MNIFIRKNDLTLKEKSRLGILSIVDKKELIIRSEIEKQIDTAYNIIKTNENYSAKLDNLNIILKSLTGNIKTYQGPKQNEYKKKLDDLYNKDRFLRGYRTGPQFV